MVQKEKLCGWCLEPGHYVFTQDGKQISCPNNPIKCRNCQRHHNVALECFKPRRQDSQQYWQVGPGRKPHVQGQALLSKVNGRKSFIRTCPVTLTHENSEASITGLAIIDDQANITLINSKVLRQLHIPETEITNTSLSTINAKIYCFKGFKR